jgi:hypothetical protein
VVDLESEHRLLHRRSFRPTLDVGRQYRVRPRRS